MSKIKTRLLDKTEISKMILRLSHEIVENQKTLDSIAIIGIRTRGEIIARRITDNIRNHYNKQVDLGILDVTFYRDDFRTNLGWLISRETIVGLANGFLWAAVVGLIASFWFNDIIIAQIIAIAMIFNLLVGVISGVTVPSILKYFTIDPGVAGSVIVTTITDVSGFICFLGLASLYYG